VALDVPSKSEAARLVERLREQISFFKIGLQLYTAEGPEIVEAVTANGAKVFLDSRCGGGEKKGDVDLGRDRLDQLDPANSR